MQCRGVIILHQWAVLWAARAERSIALDKHTEEWPDLMQTVLIHVQDAICSVTDFLAHYNNQPAKTSFVQRAYVYKAREF